MTVWTIQSWNSAGQNTGMDSLSLHQGIFPTQGLNPGLLYCKWFFTSWGSKEAHTLCTMCVINKINMERNIFDSLYLISVSLSNVNIFLKRCSMSYRNVLTSKAIIIFYKESGVILSHQNKNAYFKSIIPCLLIQENINTWNIQTEIV